jgi:hypothetical protein
MQPVARGWARYRWGLNQRSQSQPFSQSQAPAAAMADWEEIDQLRYWSEQGADRYLFLGQILAQLEEQRWQTKTDTGWTNHDIEIFGNRWSRLRVVTASEELDQGRKIFRCRLETNWSLRAKLTFCLVLGLELFVIGLFAAAQPWLWMLLLSLPLLGWYLEHEKRSLQFLIARLLDQVATQMHMVKLRYRAQDQTLVRAEK